MPVFLAPFAGKVWLAVLIAGLAGSAHQGWSANLFSVVSDTMPKEAISSVVGLGGFICFFTGGFVNTLVLDISERIYVGGDFTSVGGNINRRFLARLTSLGQLDTSFAPNLNGSVFTEVTDQIGNVLVGGLFTNINGTARNYLARINSQNGGLDNTFTPTVDSSINKILLEKNGPGAIASRRAALSQKLTKPLAR